MSFTARPPAGSHNVERRILEPVDEVGRPLNRHTLTEPREAARVGETRRLRDRVDVGLDPTAEIRHAGATRVSVSPPRGRAPTRRRSRSARQGALRERGRDPAPGSATASCSTTASCASAIREHRAAVPSSRRMLSSSTRPLSVSVPVRLSISGLRDGGDAPQGRRRRPSPATISPTVRTSLPNGAACHTASYPGGVRSSSRARVGMLRSIRSGADRSRGDRCLVEAAW